MAQARKKKEQIVTVSRRQASAPTHGLPTAGLPILCLLTPSVHTVWAHLSSHHLFLVFITPFTHLRSHLFQDAEPLYDKPITMKELFPKEFWRI